MEKESRRPRANSAPSVAAFSTKLHTHVHYPHDLQLNKVDNICDKQLEPIVLPGGEDNQSPTIKSNGLTMSGQEISPQPRGSTGGEAHPRRQRRGTLGRALSISQAQKENIELNNYSIPAIVLSLLCCRINVLLVVMQLCLGATVTALAFYMQTLTPTLNIRECPYWAGVPLLLAGVAGIYFCATDFAAYVHSTKSFAIKCICITLSTSCVFLCMIASVFPGIHGNRISSFAECNMTVTKCTCAESEQPNARIFTYEDIDSCESVITSVKDYLILQCSLNSIASGVCAWFVYLLWKSRYQKFYSGLRFHSYGANGPSHHWADQVNHRNTGAVQPLPSPIIGYHTHGKVARSIYDRHEHV